MKRKTVVSVASSSSSSSFSTVRKVVSTEQERDLQEGFNQRKRKFQSMNQDGHSLFSKSVDREGWNTVLDGILLDLTVDAFTQRGVFSRWNKHKPPVKCLRGWEQITEEFNKQCSRHGSYLKTPTALCCRLSFLKKQAEKVKFKLGGSPLKESFTLLFKNNKLTIPSFMTECGEDERPRSRSPTRTAPGSSGPGSSGQYTPHHSAFFATPAAGSTSYASPTCATPSAAEYEEVNKILAALGINPKAIPYIVGAITSYEAKGLIYSAEYTRRSFVEDLQMRYFNPQPYQPYQPHDFR